MNIALAEAVIIWHLADYFILHSERNGSVLVKSGAEGLWWWIGCQIFVLDELRISASSFVVWNGFKIKSFSLITLKYKKIIVDIRNLAYFLLFFSFFFLFIFQTCEYCRSSCRHDISRIAIRQPTCQCTKLTTTKTTEHVQSGTPPDKNDQNHWEIHTSIVIFLVCERGRPLSLLANILLNIGNNCINSTHKINLNQ